MLATGLPRDIVLDIINVPFRLRSGGLAEAERSILIAGFIKGFQVAFYVAASLMAFATILAFALIEQIDLDQAHGGKRRSGSEVPAEAAVSSKV
jgi:hypothetical protein